MPEMIKINIDGRDLEVETGITVLQAARKANIDIPTLCFLKEINAVIDLKNMMIKGENRKLKL